MMRLRSKRIYDSKNRLIYELHNGIDETINKYDDKGNLIYSKNWNLKNGEIFYEYSQEFDSDNNLVHLIDYEYKVDTVYKYTSGSDLIKCISKYENNTVVQNIKKDEIYINKVEKPDVVSETVDLFGNRSLYEYDNHGNVSKITDLDEDGNPCLEIDYENIYE